VLIVIGTSLGGLQALQVILSGFSKNFSVPIAIVQHRHKSSNNNILIDLLQEQTYLVVKEAEDKEDILPGYVYLAPADYHLLIEVGYFSLSLEAPVNYARPSIDVLFETAADSYAQQVIGILLTGANHDGVKGMTRIQARGGFNIVQEPTTALCPTMPSAAIAAGVASVILPLSDIAPFLQTIITTRN
jgi:two-component system chemotaxis response regulator CheB